MPTTNDATLARLAKPTYRWYALGVLVLVFTSSHVDRQIMGILLEPIKLDLGASDTQMGFLIGLTFALFYATLGMPIAMLADRSNRRNIIAAAIAIWSGMTVACAYAATFTQLALARIGVAVGEAGSNPPSHSMISDLFPLHERGTAMGIFAVGINLGLLIAYLGGGYLSEHYGWRTTFIVVGAPGLLIALIVRFSMIEPPRGLTQRPVSPLEPRAVETPSDVEAAPAFWDVVKTVAAIPALRHIIIGGSLASFVGYGMVLWLPAFFVRSHGLSQSETGLTLALMTGVVGGIGTFTAGRAADVFARRDLRWNMWLVALAKIVLVPFLVAFFLTAEFLPALLLYVVPAFLGGFYLGPGFAMIQGLVPAHMRAVTASINLFLTNMIGLGLGPQGVGIVSDLLSARFGNESLRYSLMIFGCVNLWAAVHYYLASRTLRENLREAQARVAA